MVQTVQVNPLYSRFFRITEPTSGEVKIRGKVVSLLEVGTGFHPELTVEKMYTLIGDFRNEPSHVNERIDEIIDFAGVNEFIDTPIKDTHLV